MDRLRKAALLTRLIGELWKKDSWCGETHVQKATYFAKEVAGIDLSHEFVLYRHGPFSFDLRSDLAGLRADGMTALEVQYPYGPRIALTDRAAYIQSFYPKTLKRYRNKITFVASKLGNKGVADLERLGTGFFLSRHGSMKNAGDEEIGRHVNRLKRHISPADAIEGLQEAREIEAEAKARFFS